MESRIDPRLVALFGSETRVRTLVVLAGAYRPMTAYRVAKVGEVPVQKAYEEMRRLVRSGLVARRDGGWILVDGDVRALLRKRVRVLWYDDWRAERERTAPARRSFLRRLETLPPLKFQKGWKPRNPESLVRDPRKDEILRELGRRTSVHG